MSIVEMYRNRIVQFYIEINWKDLPQPHWTVLYWNKLLRCTATALYNFILKQIVKIYRNRIVQFQIVTNWHSLKVSTVEPQQN